VVLHETFEWSCLYFFFVLAYTLYGFNENDRHSKSFLYIT
jgi:hypothetical protein